MASHRIDVRLVLPFALVVAVSGCGSDSERADVADTAEADGTSDVAEVEDIAEVEETASDTAIADSTPRDGREDVADGDQNPNNLLLDYAYGNQVIGSTLTIDALGVTTRSERICCPPTTTPTDTVDLGFSQIAGLRADIEAVAAADEVANKELGPFAEGASVGSVTVYRNGYAYVVMAYENQGDRVRITSVANDARTRILALVNGIVDVDLLD